MEQTHNARMTNVPSGPHDRTALVERSESHPGLVLFVLQWSAEHPEKLRAATQDAASPGGARMRAAVTMRAPFAARQLHPVVAQRARPRDNATPLISVGQVP